MAKKDLDKLLELANLADLNLFVRRYSKKDQKFCKELTNYLSDLYLDEEEGASDALSDLEDAFSSSQNIGDRWHRFEVTDWNEVCNVGRTVLKKAYQLAGLGNAKAALSIAIRMFELGIQGDLNYVDEMDEGNISDIYEQFGKLMIGTLSEDSISQEEKDNAINVLRNAVKSQLHDYGYIDGNSLLREAIAASQSEEEMLETINQMLKETSSEYELAEYVRKKVELLTKMNKTKEAENTVKHYLYLPSIRKDEINKSIENNQLDAAFKLAEDGRKQALKNDKIQNDWLEIEFDICGKIGNTQKQIEISRTLFVSKRGSKEDYQRLKKLIPKSQWPEFLTNMLNETKMGHFLGSSIEADIYVAEKDINRLFELLMRNDHHTMEMYNSYAHYVNDNHAQTIVSEYIDLIKTYASSNMGAKHYSHIRYSMENLQKCKGGKEAAHQLAIHLRDTYSRRPSLLKEINSF